MRSSKSCNLYFLTVPKSEMGMDWHLGDPERIVKLSLRVIPGIALLVFVLTGCTGRSIYPRPYFIRSKGGYIIPEASRTNASLKMKRPARLSSPALKKITDSYLGIPYRWGGGDRSGMDCSGFVQRVFAEAYRLELPHNSGKIAMLGRTVSRRKLKTGDVVMFGSLFGIHHVGIYMAEGRFIHASVGKGVIYSKLTEPYYQKKYKGARRIVE